MIYSNEQQQAIDKALRWYEDPAEKQVFRIDGLAGTGKTTIAHAINKALGERALAAAFTGKAASVMRNKGLTNASTVHSLIYQPVGNDAEGKFKELRAELKTLEAMPGSPLEVDNRRRLLRMGALRRQLKSIEDDARQPKFVLKEESDLSAAPLLILDELSQIDELMAKDLLSFGVKMLVLGDPGQLPPIRGTGYFTIGEPDVFLREPHRQAANSPIIRLAHLAREGKSIPYGAFEWECPETGQRSAAYVQRGVTAGEARAADIVLCGTNSKRQSINRRHRELEGYAELPMPQPGEPLMCLKNNRELGLYNGQVWRVVQGDQHWQRGDGAVYLRIKPEEGGVDIGVPCEADLFYNDQEKSPWSSSEQFTWGYCATVHKAQGSGWSEVLGFMDWPSSRSYREWAYTLITRAADTLRLVM